MSEQILPGVVPDINIDVLRPVESAVMRTIVAIQAPRKARARHGVRIVVTTYSVERLAAFGWSTDDIRRLKSL